MGHWNTCPPPPSSSVLFFWSFQSRTNSELYVVTYPQKNILANNSVTVYCFNFIIFLCVAIKLFSLVFVPLLALNPGDATGWILSHADGTDSLISWSTQCSLVNTVKCRISRDRTNNKQCKKVSKFMFMLCYVK